jgi:hypothetical protein
MMSLFGGDFKYLWQENLKEFAQFPSAWDSILNSGLGVYIVPRLWLNTYVSLTTLFGYLGMPWIVIVLLFWTLPVFIGSFFFTLILFRYLFPTIKRYSFVAGLIYSLNTYILMVVLGGQMGVGLAYSVVPLVIYRFIKTFAKPNISNALIAGLALGLQILFDPRFVYMTLLVTGLYWLFIHLKCKFKYIFFCFIIPLVLAVLFHMFWILPLLLHQGGGISIELGTLKTFSFFSFADFPHTFSLLHPNWPENIFGKTYFLREEYLILPIIAFSSLLFVAKKNNSENRAILFFSLLSIIGAFLAKGDNPPFEQINRFLFTDFPGMQMFRDSTKWYTLTALAYSMLVPFALFYIQKWLSSKVTIRLRNLILVFTYVCIVGYSIFLLIPLFTASHSILKIRNVPVEYRQLKDFLYNQHTFFRTLWVPQVQRYGFLSYEHPALSAPEFFETDKRPEVLKKLTDPNTPKALREASVKYIILPLDSEKEIFVSGPNYSEKQYKDLYHSIQKLTWLREISSVKGIHIFEINDYQEHFWIKNTGKKVTYKRTSPTDFKVNVSNVKKGDLLVFSEGFDNGWKARVDNNQVTSKTFSKRLNSFVLPQDGNYTLDVYFEPQKWVKIGMVISTASLIFICAVLVGIKMKKKRL